MLNFDKATKYRRQWMKKKIKIKNKISQWTFEWLREMKTKFFHTWINIEAAVAVDKPLAKRKTTQIFFYKFYFFRLA